MTENSAPEPLAFYFDFISPYAYLAWRRLREAARREPAIDRAIRPRPVLFAALLAHHGQLGPAEIEAKRRFLVRDCLRLSRRHGIPFTMPATHPFRPITALRLALPEVAGERQVEAIDAIFAAGWERGEELSDPACLRAALEGAGLDGAALLERASAPEAKAALVRAGEEAIGAGVFGVPTFVVRGECVWGQDRIEDALALARGEGAVDEAEVEALLSRRPSASRG